MAGVTPRIVNVSCLVLLPALFCALTVKEYLPAFDGAPLIVPFEESVRFGGRVPL